MKVYYTLLCCLISLLSSQAQIDTAFWFAAPAVSPDAWWKEDVRLQISALGSSATVRLYQPAIAGNAKYDTTFSIAANTTFNYTLWRHKIASPLSLGFDSLEVRPVNSVVPYGLKIASSAKIRVVYTLQSRAPSFFNPERFSLKGRNALGTAFLCPFSNQGLNHTLLSDLNGDGQVTPARQRISVVASRPNTTVWFTTPCAIAGYPANTTHSVLLVKAGDCYAIENASAATATVGNNLSGSEILANKPIAVTVSDDSFKGVSSGCYDLVGNQLVPVNKTGTNYVLTQTPSFTTSPAGAYVVATQNSTQISFNNGITTTTTTLNKGNLFYYKLTTPSASLTCSAPAYCWFMTGLGCEMSGELLAPVNCGGANTQPFTRFHPQTMEVDIICLNTVSSTFTLTDAFNTPVALNSLSFYPVAGTNTLISPYYVTAKITAGTLIPVPPGDYRLSNTAGPFVIRVTEGGQTTGSTYHESASFTGDTEVSVAGTSTVACKNQSGSITLNGFVGGNAPNGIWTTANGTGTFAPYTSTTNLVYTTYSLSTADQLGSSLKFYLTAQGGCLPVKDSVVVQLNTPASIFAPPFFAICSSSTAVFQATTNPPSNAIAWSGGTGTFSSPTGSIVTYTLGAGDYTNPLYITITATQAIPGCSNTSVSVYCMIGAPFQVAAAAYPSTICVGQAATLSGYPGTSSSNQVISSQWWGLSGNPVVVSPGTTTSYTYSASYTAGCSSSTVVTVTVDACIGITELNGLANSSVFPNPSTGTFNLNLPPGNYIIYDGMGKEIFKSDCDGKPQTLSLATKPAGVYVLKFTRDSGSHSVLKLIKHD